MLHDVHQATAAQDVKADCIGAEIAKADSRSRRVGKGLPSKAAGSCSQSGASSTAPAPVWVPANSCRDPVGCSACGLQSIRYALSVDTSSTLRRHPVLLSWSGVYFFRVPLKLLFNTLRWSPCACALQLRLQALPAVRGSSQGVIVWLCYSTTSKPKRKIYHLAPAPCRVNFKLAILRVLCHVNVEHTVRYSLHVP